MKLKLLPYVLFAVSALAFFAMVSNRSSSSGSLRGLQSTNSDDVSAVNSVLPLTFTISGVSQLVQALVEASAISNSTFDTISVNALSSSVNGDIIDYELALSLTNDENVTIDGYIQGVYNSTSGNIDFTTASYNLSAVESDSSDVSEEVSEEVSEVEESSDAENATEVLLSNYTSISASQVSQDAIALAAVKYGSRNVLANLINEGDIPALAPSYSINPIVSAGYKNQSDANYYLFSVHMINAAYINVNTTFVVSYNGNYSLKYFTYLAYNYTAAQFNMTSLPTTTANTTSNVTSNGTVVDPNNVSGNTNVTIGVSVGNTTNVTAPANTTNSTAPSSNTTVAVNATSSTANTTAATWTAIDTSKISSNTKALGGLKYGAKAVLSNIINSGKIPAYYPNYSISKINSAAYQNQINNVTLYKYNVSMVNAAYIHVNSTFTVAYNGNNGNYTLKNYTWTAYNYTQAEFNMTTPTSTTTTANTTTTTTPSVNSTSTSTANNTSSSSTGTGSGATTLPASESESVSEDSDITPGIMLGSDTAVF